MLSALKQIPYKNGDLINGFKFIRELDNPNGFYSTKFGLFECPYCHKEFRTMIRTIETNRIIACGCQTPRISREKNSIHGFNGTKLYNTYRVMKQRCYNPNNKHYYLYGGAGIKMCDEWLASVKVFCEYMMSLPNYGKKGYSIDRKDPNGNYEPDNVRWACQQVQAANQRKKNPSVIYTGVHPLKGRWYAHIMYKYKLISLGGYKTAEEACIARDKYIIDNELWQYPLQILKRPCLN